MSTTSEQLAADRCIDGLDTLHSAPQVVQQVLSLTSDPEFEVAEVVACIESDPALATRLLRIVNSAHYGLRQPAASVRKAALYLGRRSLRMVAVTFGFVSALTQGRGGGVYSAYWKRSLLMAGVAAQLARRKHGLDPHEAYTAGLLADLGVLVFAQCGGVDYAAVHERHEHGPDLVEAERQLFDCGHPALGARLLARWELPEALADAVAPHHEEQSDGDLSLAVRAADLTADALLAVDSPRITATRRLLRDEFDLHTDGFIDLALSARSDLENMADLFGVSDHVGFDCERVVAEARRRHLELSMEAALDMDSFECAYADATTPL
ncbi:MAG TPA: HDOD domain-containing protein [Planctomycetaceae bacterium]|nr:HDOD domain-containing protein [Planctomycetaceae bacterium]